jgi:GNAT superfamily N-acetyltransferase
MSTIIEFPTPLDSARLTPNTPRTSRTANHLHVHPATIDADRYAGRRRTSHLTRVRVASSPRDRVMLRGLFAEQRQWLIGHGLSVEEFDADTESEYNDPPAYYADRGVLLFASRGWTGLGIVALRHIDANDVELRRMYVSPSARGTGAGSALLDAAIESAKRSGYQRILLATLSGAMEAAIRMYRDRGFSAIEPFHVEHPDVIAMELSLART